MTNKKKPSEIFEKSLENTFNECVAQEQKEKCQCGYPESHAEECPAFDPKEKWNKDEFSRQCPVCRKNERVPAFNACAQCHHEGITKIQIAPIPLQEREPEASWEERICIVRAKNSHGALFQPCVYLDNTMVKDIETLKSFICSTLATQEKKLRESLAKEIEEKWIPKKTYKDYGIQKISMTLDDHKRNFAKEILSIIRNETNVDAAKIVKGEKK